jgi:hypothetical protein
MMANMVVFTTDDFRAKKSSVTTPPSSLFAFPTKSAKLYHTTFNKFIQFHTQLQTMDSSLFHHDHRQPKLIFSHRRVIDYQKTHVVITNCSGGPLLFLLIESSKIQKPYTKISSQKNIYGTTSSLNSLRQNNT